MYACTACVSSAHGGQKRASDPVKPELKKLSHPVGAGNQPRSSEKSSKITENISLQPCKLLFYKL